MKRELRLGFVAKCDKIINAPTLNRNVLYGFLMLLVSAIMQGQATLYSTNFGTTDNAAVNTITGWTASGAQAGNLILSTATASSGYTTPTTSSASGNLSEGVSAFVTGTSVATLAGQVNTTGHSSIEVAFGYRASSSAYVTTITLEWSSNGTAWNTLSLGTITKDGNWKNTNWLALPAGAENQANLRFRFTFVRSNASGNFKIDDFTVRGYAPCSGTPAPGNSLAATNPVVGGSTTLLSMSGSLTSSSLTFQWQQSTTNATTGFTNISGANSATYTASPTARTWYRCLVTCTNAGGGSATSSSVEVNLTYCAPTYANGPGTTDQITNVTLGTLNNTSGASSSPYYTFFNAATIPNITQGSTANVSVTYGSDGTQYGAVWIDFNQNGVFETTEGLVSANAGANGTSVFNFSVPSGAIVGNTRMRVRGGNDNALTTGQACGASSNGYGETEDYIVNIVAASVNPVLAITGTTAHGSTCPTVAASPQTYTITNTGSSAATGVTVVSNDPQFVVSGLSSTTIAGSGTATYTVTFTPSSAGAKTATITVASVTAGSNSPTSSLTGTGTTPVTPTVTTAAATSISTTTVTLGASASTFGVCPTTTVKGFAISQTSVNATPTIGGSGVTNETVATLGTQGAFTKAIIGLSTGTNYSFRAYLYDGTTYTYGAVQTFTTLVPPANDVCTDAQELVINAAAVSGTMLNATTTAAIDSYPDVWYKFTPSCIGKYTITLGGFTGDLDLYYFTSCGTSSPTQSVSTSSSAEVLTTSSSLSASTTYYIRVRAFNPAVSTSTFTISVSNQMTIFTHPSNSSVTSGATATFASSMPANATGYQWQINTGSGWTDVSTGTGGTTNSYTTPATTMAMNGYQYRVVISNGTCTTATSNPATLTVAACTPSSTNSTDYISGFSTTGGTTNISNASTTYSTGGYGNFYATHSATQTAGMSLNFTETYNGGNHGFKIWVDWNKDGDFTGIGEEVYTPSASGTGFTGSFTIPVTTTPGDYRMRIRAIYNATGLPASMTPCGSVSWGEAEDYKLIVVAGTTDTRLNFVSATHTAAESVGTVNFCVAIMNPSSTVATTANIVKTTVSGTHISTTTFPVTFPAGSSTQQCVSIPIADNTTCSDTSIYNFELQAVSGGISAAAGIINQTSLTVNDNDTTTGVFRRIDFEGCNNWDYATTATASTRSNSNRYNGTSSMSLQNGGTLTTNNIDLTSYSNVTLSVAFAAIDVDPTDVLHMDLSYDGGSTWPGANSTILFTPSTNNVALNINSTTTGSVASNPYTVNIPGGSTQVRVRFRTVNTTNAGEYYYIDDITLTGIGCNVSPVYGNPSVTTASTYYINDAKFQGINAVQKLASSYSTSPSGYQDWTSHTKTIQAQGEPINISLAANTPVHWKAWVDWNKDGAFNTSTEQVFTNGTYTGQFSEFGFVIPANTAPGDYRIRFRVSNASSSFDACANTTNGEAEDYLFTVIPSCSAVITNITEGETCGPGTVDLAVTASGSPTAYRWYDTETGGSLLATTTSANWTTPNLTTTTTYYVTAFNGCESINRTAIVATVSPLPTLTFNNPSPSVCGETSIIELSVSGDKQEVVLFDEKFNSGLGLFQNINTDTNNATFDNLTGWSNKTSTHLPNGNLWTPAISSGITGNKFAFATSDIVPSTAPNNIENSLTLITGVNTTDFLNLTLTLRVFYSRYLNDDNSTYAGNYYQDDLKVEVYNGSTWTTLATYDEDLGIGNKFATLTFNLPSSYIGLTDFKVRVRHFSSSSSTLYFPGGVAVDDIKLYGEKNLNTAFEWTSSPTINAYTDAACTDLYDSLTDVATTVYFKATETQLVNPAFTITANAELSNGCTATDDIVISNDTKYWTGINSNNWMDAGNWSPTGVPNATQCIVVNTANSLTIPSPQSGFGKNLTIKTNGVLNINSGASITITDGITISDNGTPSNPADDGKLMIQEGGSLLQVTDVNNATANNNIGNINMERHTKQMFRYDFTYWSSPVTADSNYTLHDLSPITLFDKYFKWNHSGSVWQAIPNGTEAMVPGRGYIVRAPQNFPVESATATASIHTVHFIGKPNNGTVRHAVSGGTGKWNLIGNPYPSAINADAFLDFNTDPSGNNVLGGTLYFWTHNTGVVPTVPGSELYIYNAGDYASYNTTGSVATVPGDGVINMNAPNGFIAAGQSFFVAGTANGDVIFNNTMRATGNNNQFFRPASTEPINNWDRTGKHRVWLNMKGETRGFCQALVGYIENATNGFDNRFDGDSFGGNQVTFYSLLENKKLVIQGRALPFNNQDEVPLGYKSTLNGTLTISIDHYDGLFEGQDVYLEDKLLNIVHDLKESAYSFTSTIGTFNERFVLRYLPSEELSNPAHEAIANGLIVYQENNIIMLKSQLEDLSVVTVYDLLGRIVFDQNSIGKREFGILNVVMNEQPLIIKVKLANGQVVNKKIVY